MSNSTSDADLPEPPKVPERIWLKSLGRWGMNAYWYYERPNTDAEVIEYQRVHQQSDGELLPCPFCGSTAFISFDGDDGVPNDWSANCIDAMNCGATVAGLQSEESARALWNTRVHAPVDYRVNEIVQAWASADPDAIDDLDALCRIAEVLDVEVEARSRPPVDEKE